MHEELPYQHVFGFASGLLLVALAVFMASVRPRLRANLAFAAFAFFFGGAFVVGTATLPTIFHLDPRVREADTLFLFGWVAALAAIAFLFPVPLAARERRFLFSALGLFLLLFAAAIPSFPFWTAYADIFFALGIVIATAAIPACLLLLTLRFRTMPGQAERRQVAIAAAALAIFAGVMAGTGIEPEYFGAAFLAKGPFVPVAIARFLAMLGTAALWLAWTPGPGGRMARNVGLLCLASTLAGLLVASLRPEFPWGPATQMVMALLLTYAILRHQFLGVDLRVRWGVSKGVLAGIFLAVFFTVTELTRWYFENRAAEAGVERYAAVAGILAAALLLFAISPLHRLTDRLAARTVPVTVLPGPAADKAAQAYRRALRLALRDRVLSEAEEEELAYLASDLGLDPGTTHRLRRQVLNEAGMARRGRKAPRSRPSTRDTQGVS